MTPSELKAKGLAVTLLRWWGHKEYSTTYGPDELGVKYEIFPCSHQGWYMKVRGEIHSVYDTLEDAKAAARADYEARICAALTEVRREGNTE